MDEYAGSRAVREQIQAALNRELGVPVTIESLHYWPWSGLCAKGVATVLGPTNAQAAPQTSLFIPSVSANIALWPLLSGHVVVKSLLFKEPVMTLVESGGGGWNPPLAIPGALPPIPPILPAPNGIEPGAISSAPTIPLAKAPPKTHEKKPKPERALKMDFRIQTAQIKNATFRCIDSKGAVLALLEGVTVSCPIEIPDKIDGSAAIRKTTLANGLAIENFSTPFQLNGESLTLSHIDARLAGGSIRGAGTAQTIPDHAPFTLDLLFDGVNLQQLLTETGEEQTGRRTAGTLNGNLDIYGRIGKTKSVRGTGQLRLRGGRMEQVPLLQLIGKVLLIEELKDVELRQAQLDLRADQGRVFVDSLVMESSNLSLAAKGTSEFDGRLDLAARLAVNPKVSKQLPAWVDANFQPVKGSDRRDIGFNVTGTLSRPETDLMQVMVGKKYGNQIMNLFQSITGKQKKTGDKKKPKPSPAEEGEEIPESSPQSQPAGTP